MIKTMPEITESEEIVEKETKRREKKKKPKMKVSGKRIFQLKNILKK